MHRIALPCLAAAELLLPLALALTPAVADADAGGAAARSDQRGWKEVTFRASDDLEITADLYLANSDKKTPFLVLFHRAGWSRGEYREIAPRLNKLGWNCMAVDQRSGGAVNGIENQTAVRARRARKSGRYIDAVPDLEAAIAYARQNYAEGLLFAWGSSYSSSLLLALAGEKPQLVDGVLAFAPGDYFKKQGKPGDWVRKAAARIDKPVFITSAKNEKKSWEAIYAAIPGDSKRFYLPEKSAGHHGSEALWARYQDSAGYWKAVELFLASAAPAK